MQSYLTMNKISKVLSSWNQN